MKVRAIKTAASECAVNNIKNMNSKKFDYGVSFEIPQEFIEKRNYMQSSSFLKDTHNIIMFNLIKDMMSYRDRIREQINEINKKYGTKFVQAINGFIRDKENLNNDFALNFDDVPSVNTNTETQYRVLRNVLLWTQAKGAK